MLSIFSYFLCYAPAAKLPAISMSLKNRIRYWRRLR